MAQQALQHKAIEHMLVGYVHLFFYLPRGAFAVGASIVPTRNDLIIYSAENALTFLAFLRIIDGDAVANGTGDELSLQETVAYPLLIYKDELRFADLCLVDL